MALASWLPAHLLCGGYRLAAPRCSPLLLLRLPCCGRLLHLLLLPLPPASCALPLLLPFLCCQGAVQQGAGQSRLQRHRLVHRQALAALRARHARAGRWSLTVVLLCVDQQG